MRHDVGVHAKAAVHAGCRVQAGLSAIIAEIVLPFLTQARLLDCAVRDDRGINSAGNRGNPLRSLSEE